VREHASKTPVVEIPFLYTEPDEPPSPAESLRLRQKLCSAAYLFGIFGYLRESKCVTVALRAFQKVRAARPNSALLLAGDFVSSDLARTIGPLLRQPGVVRVGHLPEREFWRVAAATDACINLRYPSAAETSAIAIRFMGMGKPVIVSSGEEMTRYPESACLRVDYGPEEEEMLAQYMLSLRHLSGMGTGIGRRAAEHILRWHSIERVAKLYWETLCAYSQRA